MPSLVFGWKEILQVLTGHFTVPLLSYHTPLVFASRVCDGHDCCLVVGGTGQSCALSGVQHPLGLWNLYPLTLPSKLHNSSGIQTCWFPGTCWVYPLTPTMWFRVPFQGTRASNSRPQITMLFCSDASGLVLDPVSNDMFSGSNRIEYETSLHSTVQTTRMRTNHHRPLLPTYPKALVENCRWRLW